LRRDCSRTAGFDGHVPLLLARPDDGVAVASLTGLDAVVAVRFMGARCRWLDVVT